VAARTDDAIARIDAARLRRAAQMLAPAEAPDFEADPDVVLDISKLDGKGLLERYRERQARYVTSPFDPNGSTVRFYPGGVTIWSGFPGAGKTTLLRQLVCFYLQRDIGTFTASLEEHPEDQLNRLIETAAGTGEPNAHQAQWFIDQFATKLRVWAKVGLTQHRKLLGVIRQLASQGLISQVVIDSLMKLDVSSDDIEEQRQFVNLLDATAKQTGCHIHLVAHPKKPSKADDEPDQHDVAGAKEIAGIADNVLFVRRRKADTVNDVSSGVRIVIAKKRFGRGQPKGHIDGWFHQDLCQYSPLQFPSGPIRYLPADAYTGMETKGRGDFDL
jgi:KaiC/GvpD/RAD55 family RecA-like ATPase